MAWGDVIQMLGAGGGGSILGLAIGSVTREAKFNARVDRELAELRGKVALCEAERTEFAIVKMGVRMLIPELRRHEPENPVLLSVAVAFEELPAADHSMIELLGQIRAERGESGNDVPDA